VVGREGRLMEAVERERGLLGRDWEEGGIGGDDYTISLARFRFRLLRGFLTHHDVGALAVDGAAGSVAGKVMFYQK
jgi:hypothetical protein